MSDARQQAPWSPAAAALSNAPFDNETETKAEQVAFAEARQWLSQNGGRGVPHAEAMRRLGLV